MGSELTSAPVLSTPDNHILSEVEPVATFDASQRLSDEQIWFHYEIDRTLRDIRQHQWHRVALQFPDHMLRDSARVYQFLSRGLNETQPHKTTAPKKSDSLETAINSLDLQEQKSVKLTILGDTSYGSCCVDEIAAEHVDADVVVHYGRSCLSPSARLPVLHIFTQMELDYEAVIRKFEETYADKKAKVILTADTPYAEHISKLSQQLSQRGYEAIIGAEIYHDPSALIPNRSLPDSLKANPESLSEWHLFHISEPPTALLLTLTSRVNCITIFSTTDNGTSSGQANTAVMLRRRYALITSMTTVSTWGILINTLSVKNYLHIVDYVRRQIEEAGKKSYLFVVGKLNAAKVANFSEIGGWVVIGCWESSLIDSKDFYKPIITPFELDLVLQGDEGRIWTGQWRGDFQEILDKAETAEAVRKESGTSDQTDGDEHRRDYDEDSEEESAPPEFDLRTGKYVSHSRPLGSRNTNRNLENASSSTALTRRANGDIIAVNGVASPAAQFLAEQRTWKGLGSDFEIKYEEDEMGGLIEEGRTGVARGYTVGDSSQT